MDLNGQVAIVTGAAKRIGRSIALALGREGTDILVHYGTSADAARETVEDLQKLGVRAACVSADLSNPHAAAETIFSQCKTALRQPTILINSAAIFEPGTVRGTTTDNWSRHLGINLESPFALMQELANTTDSGNSASVVNIVDWRAHVNPPGHLAYTISKTGLLAMTRMAAQELAPNIRVNAIAPGPMLPPPGKDESYLGPVVEKLPLQRSGSPEDIAQAVVYLCKADFVTGTLIHVDGGQQFTGGKA